MSAPSKSVFLDRDSLDRGDLDLSALDAALPGLESWGATPPAKTLERVREARIIISNKVVIDGQTLSHCRHLELIVVAATGTNNVDLEAAAARGVAVCNVRDYATSSVAQHVFALILGLSRQVESYARAVREGRWNDSPFFCLLDYPISDLQGQSLGIIGYGTLGRAVARLGEAFGMNILIGARPGSTAAADGRTDLDTLYRESDVISLHCPLTPETERLIGPAELAAMKSSALLINTARGGIVDELALFQTLQAGDIGGAGIDVLEVEPPDGSSPLQAAELPNLIVTPHNAWASRRCRQNLVDQLVDIVVSYETGDARNRVI
ncbi:MAG: D-2-hydroxyacid dehydrogenase [Proteobacteria bacterium]|nr:MAG: D-2-hydroxyacid dehydrogenase [Pseudomonadota bacterium]